MRERLAPEKERKRKREGEGERERERTSRLLNIYERSDLIKCQSHSFRNVTLIRYMRNYDLQWSEIQLSLSLSLSFLSYYISRWCFRDIMPKFCFYYACFSEFLLRFIHSRVYNLKCWWYLSDIDCSSSLPFFSICELVLAHFLQRVGCSYLYQSRKAYVRYIFFVRKLIRHTLLLICYFNLKLLLLINWKLILKMRRSPDFFYVKYDFEICDHWYYHYMCQYIRIQTIYMCNMCDQHSKFLYFKNYCLK